MNDKIQVREADSQDVDTITDILRQSFSVVAREFELTEQNCPAHPSNAQNSWVQSDMTEGIAYYLLEVEGTAKGCVAMKISPSQNCRLERLAVLPQSQRKGFGNSLVQHVISEAKKQGCVTISIAIIAQHRKLQQWYELFGFRERETREFEHLPFQVMFMTHRLS